MIFGHISGVEAGVVEFSLWDILRNLLLAARWTVVLSLIGLSAAIILQLNLRHKTVETIPDYAKSLVWQQNFEVLKNQYFIAQRQFEMLNLLDGQVRGVRVAELAPDPAPPRQARPPGHRQSARAPPPAR